MIKIIIILIIVIMLLSCTAGPNNQTNKKDSRGNIAGFFKGLWHGLICVITLIISIFNDNVTIYEVHNSGFFYNLGFLLGAGVITGGTHWSRKKKK